MKKIKFLFGTFALIFAIIVIGCGGGETPPPEEEEEEPPEDPRVEKTIPIDSSTESYVFMFITNKGDSVVDYTEFNDVLQNSPSSRSALPEYSGIPHNDLANDYSHYKCGLGIETVRNAYNIPLTKKSSASRTISNGTYKRDVNKTAAKVNDTSDFWILVTDDAGNDCTKKINATCRYVNADCQIFVQTKPFENDTGKAYDYYDSTENTKVFSGTDISNTKITQSGVEKLAGKFSSIYKAEQALFGDAKLDDVKYIDIINTCDKITILISDLGYDTYKDKNGVTTGYGGTLGYFYSTDLNCGCDENGVITYGNNKYYTNQRMMFTLNIAGFYKDSSGKQLDIGGENEMYSTLGHEFNHMLNYINKTLLSEKPLNYNVWFTEMLSAMAEDFIPDYLDIPNTVQEMRLPYFLNGTNEGMIDWDGTDSVFYSYGFAYAFGAYLIRNYGGVNFVHELATNKYIDKQAITEAMKACGYNETYESVLTKFPRALVNTTSDNSKYPTFNKAATGLITKNGATYSFTFPAVDLYNFTTRYTKNNEELNKYFTNPYWKYKSKIIDGNTYEFVYGPLFLNYNSYYSLYGNAFCVKYLGKTTEWSNGVKLLYPRNENIEIEIFVP